MSKQNKYQSARLREKKKKRKVIMSASIFIVVILLCVGFVYGFNYPAFQIENIRVSELRFSDKAKSEEIARSIISGKYIGIFSKSNILFFPRSRIKVDLKKSFPSIKRVDINLKGFHEIEINSIEYEPVAIWCDANVSEGISPDHESIPLEEQSSVIALVQSDTSSSICYFLNEKGMVFVKEPELHAGVYLSFFGGIEEKENGDVIKSVYSNEKTFQSLLDLVKLIRRLDIEIQEVWTKTGEVYTLVTNKGVQLHVDDEDDIEKIFRNLETVIHEDAINKAQLDNIKYIDLRFGNRVFYKLK